MIHRTHNPRRRGVALVMVVFAIAFLSVLAVAMLEDATTDLMILRNHQGGLKALYAAHTGVAQAIAALRVVYTTTNPVSGTLVLPSGSVCTYAATIANDKPVVTVTSTGTADGFTRKVTARLVIGLPAAALPPYPVRVIWWQETSG